MSRARESSDVRLGSPGRGPTVSRARSVPALVGALLAFACSPDATGSLSDSSEPAQVLLSESPPAWFEAYATGLDVAPDGTWAFFDFRRLLNLTSGAEYEPSAGLDAARLGTFDHLGRPVVAGRLDGEAGWFRLGDPTGTATRLAHIPPESFPVWSRSGERIAYVPWSDAGRVVRIGPAYGTAEAEPYTLPGAPSAAAWLPRDSALLVLVPDERGMSSLHALDAGSGRVRRVAEDLDGPWRGSTIAVSEDGRFAYLALASAAAPDPEARHDPDADRDLDIYEVDLATGERRAVVRTPAEEVAPVLAGGALHWVAIETRMEAVLVPSDGGGARVVAEDVQGPSWRPDGRALGVTTGDWRLADWALNLDGGVVEIDAEGQPSGPVAPMVTGYHEDFSPVWSPDGAWVAYHSHRSPTPVAAYQAEGSTDDIYVRRPEAPMSAEIRLTDFGYEVGNPDWAPDGRRLLVVSWDRSGSEGRGASAWVIEMDPRTGSAVDRTRIPPPDSARGAPTWGAWSPTREEIALAFARPGADEVELWLLAPDGSDARRRLSYGGHRYGGVDWSPDGETLFYSALVEGAHQLFSIPRSGGEPRRLTDDPANLMHPQASPDGRWVAATRIRHEKRILRRPR